MRTLLYVAVALVLAAGPASAQGEPALKTFFEGKRVMVKMDMPATSAGVDVYPALERPIDFRSTAIASRPLASRCARETPRS